jgi:hypothetical protein
MLNQDCSCANMLEYHTYRYVVMFIGTIYAALNTARICTDLQEVPLVSPLEEQHRFELLNRKGLRP